MYVHATRIRDLKLVRDLELTFFRADGSLRLWTVLVGENGLGKTSLLRAIALAAVGPERANQLADVASLPDRRRPRAHVQIEGRFVVDGDDTKGHGFLESTVDVPAEINLFRGRSAWVDPPFADLEPSPLSTAQAKRDPSHEWFIAGYGVERQLPLPLASQEASDRLLGRMEPLFDRGPIIATGFADQLEHDLALQYARLLREALVTSHLLPNVSNLLLSGRGGVTKAKTLVEANRFTLQLGARGVSLPATWLSQGYQAMIAWIADLIGQVVLAHGRAIPLREIRGLVLVDELDLFVHPRWQLDLIPTLKRIFPQVQFIVTTHSPMVLPGLEAEEVIILSQDGQGNIVSRTPSTSPKLLSGSEIYDVFFGIGELYPTEAARALRTFARLAADPERTDQEEAELERAAGELRRAGVEVEPAVPRKPE
jgi:AAA domain, putative AbiEii toxin, Type IV TA system